MPQYDLRSVGLFCGEKIPQKIPTALRRIRQALYRRSLERKSMIEEVKEEFWSIVANIKEEVPYGPQGVEVKSGVKQFKAGARVDIIGSYNGPCVDIIVIGQQRKSGKFIHCVIKANVVDNLRVKKIYRPQVIEFLKDFRPNGAWIIRSKKEAEELANIIPRWASEI